MPPIRGRKAESPSLSGPRPNTIGARQHELEPLLDKLDRAAGDPTALAQRIHSRWPFRHTAARLVLEHPGGTTTVCTVACRNLSCGGASLLHGAFTHPGTRCAVHLPRLDGRAREVEGTIVRCTHVTGLVHELGVRFDAPVALREHVRLDLLAGRSTFERVHPADLVGALLCALPDQIDQRMLQHFTSETHVSLRMIEDLGQLRDPSDLACDAILIDVQNVAPEEAARAVGLARGDLPVIIAGPSLSPELCGLFGAERTVTFVKKPMVQEAVLAAIAECLLSTEREDRRPGGARPISPALKGELLGRIARRSESLRARLSANDPMGCYSVCQEIRSMAEHAGEVGATRAAETAATRLATSMSTTESLQEIGELIRACELIDPKRVSV